jgi:hypothetical protein
MGGQYDSSNPEQVKKRRIRLNKQQLKEAEDLEYVMADARGRRFMWKLLGICGIFQLSYTGNSETYFREGSRNVGLRVIADLQEYCHPEYQRMERENLNKNDSDAV